MTTANKLTVLRLILVPFFFIWFFSGVRFGSIAYAVILVLFYGVAELTDLLDGKIARKSGQVTDLGKVMDPFADVMSHLTYFTCFLMSGLMPVWAFAIIMWREFSQSFLRMLLMGKGKPMAANIFGKAKTCMYAAVSICGIAARVATTFGAFEPWMTTTMTVLSGVAAAASAISFIIYIDNVRKAGTLKDMTR